MQKLVSIFSAGIIVLLAEPAIGRAVPPVYVLGEEETAALRSCNLSHASATATAEATLRHSQIQVASRDDYLADRAVQLYVNLNALDLGSTCAVNISVSLNLYAVVDNPMTEKSETATIQFCDEGGLISWNKYEANRKVREIITDSVNKCISQYANKKSLN